MNSVEKKWNSGELIQYSLIAGLFTAVVFYLFHNNPVAYTLLITEDHIAEFSTSVCFGMAGIIILFLSFRRGPKARKVIWALIGTISLIIAAEEISWGQRIFYIDTPDFLSDNNIQKEVTLHNLVIFDSVHEKLHIGISYLILMYLALSFIVYTKMPGVVERFTRLGLPLVKVKLMPVFLLAPFFLVVHPTARADEIGEFFLGIAVLVWAVDLFISTENKWFGNSRSVMVVIGALILAVFLSGVLSYWQSPEERRSYMLNKLASHHYFNKKMYKQSEMIYTFIYNNPQYLANRTRINHAKLLQAIGKTTESIDVLKTAAKHIVKEESKRVLNSNQLRLLGTIHTLMKDAPTAEIYFNKSVKIDKDIISSDVNEDKKVEALWSISQTMAARKDIAAAIDYLKQAIKQTETSALLHKLEVQLKELYELKQSGG